MDGDSGVLIRVGFALGCDGVLLAGEGLSGEDVAVLEDDGGVAEYEVHCPVDVALAVELAVGVGVERVLKRVHLTAEEDGEVRRRHQRHRLMLSRAGGVSESHVPCNESFSKHSYIASKTNFYNYL